MRFDPCIVGVISVVVLLVNFLMTTVYYFSVLFTSRLKAAGSC